MLVLRKSLVSFLFVFGPDFDERVFACVANRDEFRSQRHLSFNSEKSFSKYFLINKGFQDIFGFT